MRGKQAVAKAKRRTSSAQCNSQPTTKLGTAKVVREKHEAHRSKEEEQRHAMQQPTNNRTENVKGSKGRAGGGRNKEEEQQCVMQQPTNDRAGNGTSCKAVLTNGRHGHNLHYDSASNRKMKNFAIWSRMLRLAPTIMVSYVQSLHRSLSGC